MRPGLCALFALLAAALVPPAVLLMQTTFSPWDDEGMVTYAIKNHLAGHKLYDEVLTQYGPAFFLMYEAVMRVLGIPATHDALRILAIVLWVAACVLMAIGVYRYTEDCVLAAIASLVTFAAGTTITCEPVHPQAIIFVLMGVATIALARLPHRRAAATLGIIVGICLATKLNQGIVLGVGVAWALLCAADADRWAAILRWPCAIGIVLLPAALMHSRFETPGMALYAVLATAANLNLVLSKPAGLSLRTGRPFLLVIAWAAGISAVILGITLLRGTTLHGLYFGLIGQHAGFDRIFWITAPLTWRRLNLLFAVASVVACIIVHRRVSQPLHTLRPLLIAATVIKPILAAAVFYAAIRGGQERMTLPALLLPWMWIGVLPLGNLGASAFSTTSRYALLSVATLQFLVAYPVAGSQQSLATIFLLPYCCLLLADTTGHLRTLGFFTTSRRALLPALAGIAVLLSLSFALFETGSAAWRRFRENSYSLTLRGSSQLRLPERELAQYECLAWNLRTRGDSVFTVPGMYSFCLWSGIDSPSLLNQTNWPFAFSHEMQKRAVPALAARLRPLIIRHSGNLREVWQRELPDPSGPLLDHVRENFKVAFKVGGYELLARNNADEPAPWIGAWWLETTPEILNARGLPNLTNSRDRIAFISIPALGGILHRIQICVPGTRGLIAATRFGNGVDYALLDENDNVTAVAATTLLRRGLDLSVPRRLIVPIPHDSIPADSTAPIVRILTTADQVLIRLPFLDFKSPEPSP